MDNCFRLKLLTMFLDSFFFTKIKILDCWGIEPRRWPYCVRNHRNAELSSQFLILALPLYIKL